MVRIIDDTPFTGSAKPKEQTQVIVPAYNPPPNDFGITATGTPAPATTPTQIDTWPSEQEFDETYGRGAAESQPVTQVSTVPYIAPANPFGVGQSGTPIPVSTPWEIDIWPAAADFDAIYGVPDTSVKLPGWLTGDSGLPSDMGALDLYPVYREDLERQAVQDTLNALFGDNERFSEWAKTDPIRAVGTYIYDYIKGDYINDFDPERIRRIAGIPDDQADLYSDDVLRVAFRQAVEDFIGSTANIEELGQNFLGSIISKLNRTLELFGNTEYERFDPVTSFKIYSLDPEQKTQALAAMNEMSEAQSRAAYTATAIQQLREEINGRFANDDQMKEQLQVALEANEEELERLNERILLNKLKLQELTSNIPLVPPVLDAIFEGKLHQVNTDGAARNILRELVNNPDIYHQLRSLDEQRRDEKLRLLEEEKNAKLEEAARKFGQHTGEFQEEYYKIISEYRKKEKELDRFEVGRKSIYEVLASREYGDLARQMPLEFLSAHFPHLTPNDMRQAFPSQSFAADALSEAYGIGQDDAFILAREKNPLAFTVYRTPMDRMVETISSTLVDHGMPSEIATPAAQVVAYSPVIAASIVGSAVGGAPGAMIFAAGIGYKAAADTVPRLQNATTMQERIMALGDLATDMIVLSPYTNHLEDAITKSIVSSLTNNVAKNQLLTIGTAIGTRIGINIAEDIPATAFVLALSGVNPMSEEAQSIYKQVAMFNTALGVAMPLSARGVSRGIPEITAFAATYVTGRFVLGMNEEDATRAAVGMALTTAIARHGAPVRVYNAATNIGTSIGHALARRLDVTGLRESVEYFDEIRKHATQPIGSLVAKVLPNNLLNKGFDDSLVVSKNRYWTSGYTASRKEPRHLKKFLFSLEEYAREHNGVVPAKIIVSAYETLYEAVNEVAGGLPSFRFDPFYDIIRDLDGDIKIGDLRGLVRSMYGELDVETSFIRFDYPGTTTEGHLKYTLYRTVAHEENGKTVIYRYKVTEIDATRIEAGGHVELVFAKSKNTVPFEVHESWLFGSTEAAQAYTLRSFIIDMINESNEKIPAVIKISNDVLRDYKRIWSALVRDAGIRIERIPGGGEIRILDADGNYTPNAERLLNRAGLSDLSKIAREMEPYIKFNSLSEALLAITDETVKAAGEYVAAYIYETHFMHEEQDEAAEKAAIYTALAFLGTTGAKILGKLHTTPDVTFLRSATLEGSAGMADLTAFPAESMRLGIINRISNWIINLFGDKRLTDREFVSKIARTYRDMLVSSRLTGDVAYEQAKRIIKGRMGFDGPFVKTADGQYIPLLDADVDEAGNITAAYIRTRSEDGTEIKGATAADLAARSPIYEWALKNDPVLIPRNTGDAIAALRDVYSMIIKPYESAFIGMGIIKDVRGDVMEGGFYIPRGTAYEVDEETGRLVTRGRPTVGGITSKTSAEHHAIFTNKAQAEVAAHMDGRSYLPFDQAIKSFVEASSIRVATQMFVDAIKAYDEYTGATLGYRLFRYPEEILKPEFKLFRNRLKQAYTQARESFRNTEKQLRQLARQNESLMRKSERVADRLQRVQQMLDTRQEDMASIKAAMAEALKEISEEIKAYSEEIKERTAEYSLKDRAHRRLLRTVDDAERDVRTLINKVFDDVPAAVRQAFDYISKHDAVGSGYQLARRYIDNFLNSRADIPEKYRARLYSINELLKQGEELVKRERQIARTKIAEFGGKVEKSEFQENLRQQRAAVFKAARDELAGLARDVAMVAEGKESTGVKKSHRTTEMRRIALRRIGGEISSLLDRIDSLEKAEPGRVKTGDTKVTKDDLRQIEYGIMGDMLKQAIEARERAIEKLATIERAGHRSAAIADEKAAIESQIDALLSDMKIAEADRERYRKILKKETDIVPVIRMRERLKAIHTEQTRLLNDIKKGIAKEADLGIKKEKLEQSINDLKKKLDDIEEIYQAKAAQARNVKNRVDVLGLRTLHFEPEIADAINKELRNRGAGQMQNLFIAINTFNNFFRSIWATGDMSFAGVTGLLAAYNWPETVRHAFLQAMQDVANHDNYGKYLLAFDERAGMAGNPTIASWQRAGLALSSEVAPGADEFLIDVTESRMSKINDRLQRVPVVRQSNIMYSHMANVVRLELASTLWSRVADKPMTPEQRAYQMRLIAEEVNKVTGFTRTLFGSQIRSLGPLSSSLFFASRWIASQFAVLHDAATKADYRGAVAREALTRMIAIGTLMTLLANERLGNETEFDPRDPNFMRIRAGGYDISLFGPWDSFVRSLIYTAQGIPGVPGEGDPLYFFRSKSSPVAGMTWDVAHGETAIGEPIDEWWALKKIMPFSAQSILEQYEKYRMDQKAGNPPTARQLAIDAAIAFISSLTGLKATPLSPRERMERLLERYGIDRDDPLAYKRFLVENADALLESGYVRMTEVMQITSESRARMQLLEEEFRSGKITLGEYVDKMRQLNSQAILSIRLRDEDFRVLSDEEIEALPEKRKWIAAGYRVYEDAQDFMGNLDPERLDMNIKEYREKYGDDAWKYFVEYTMIGDTPIWQIRTAAREFLSNLTVTVDGEEQKINYFNISRTRPGVLYGYKSDDALVAHYGYTRDPERALIKYEDDLSRLSDLVSNMKATNWTTTVVHDGKIVTVGLNKNVDPDTALAIINKYSNEIRMTFPHFFDSSGNMKQDIRTDWSRFRSTKNRNPLIDEIKQKYPFETALFDDDMTWKVIGRLTPIAKVDTGVLTNNNASDKR